MTSAIAGKYQMLSQIVSGRPNCHGVESRGGLCEALLFKLIGMWNQSEGRGGRRDADRGNPTDTAREGKELGEFNDL